MIWQTASGRLITEQERDVELWARQILEMYRQLTNQDHDLAHSLFHDEFERLGRDSEQMLVNKKEIKSSLNGFHANGKVHQVRVHELV